MKIYVVGGATNYTNFIQGVELVDSVEDAEVVMFTGGEDVDPSLYGCEKHPRTYSNPSRDLAEKAIFEKVNPKTQVCVGICRGSQFLCVMNGGLLVQDCLGHAIGCTHEIRNDSSSYQITSTHHQMQYPYVLDRKDYEILYHGVGDVANISGDKIDSDKIYSTGEPEIVYYHKEGLPKCLAVQGHPEMIPNSPVARMISNLIISLVNGTL